MNNPKRLSVIYLCIFFISCTQLNVIDLIPGSLQKTMIHLPEMKLHLSEVFPLGPVPQGTYGFNSLKEVKKLEELTIHNIQQQKLLNRQKQVTLDLEKRLAKLESTFSIISI